MRVFMTSLLVQQMTLGQHLMILATMALRRGHEADAAVAVLMVVPVDKVGPSCVLRPNRQNHPAAIAGSISGF